MAESPSLYPTPEAAIADEVLLVQVGVTPDFARHVAGMSHADIALEMTSLLQNQDAADVLAGLMQGPPKSAGSEVSAARYAEQVVFLSRAAANLGFELVRRDV